MDIDNPVESSAGNTGAMPDGAGDVAASPASPLPVVETPTVTPVTSDDNPAHSIDPPPPIVQSNDTGEPVKRGRGRPRKDATAARLSSVTPAPPRPAPAAVAPPPVQNVDYETLGKIAANLWFVSGEVLLGEDWVPAPPEIPLVKDAFRDYFKAAGVSYISPAWQLGIVLGSYSLARVRKPSIKSRVLVGVEWLKSKLRFGRKKSPLQAPGND